MTHERFHMWLGLIVQRVIYALLGSRVLWLLVFLFLFFSLLLTLFFFIILLFLLPPFFLLFHFLSLLKAPAGHILVMDTFFIRRVNPSMLESVVSGLTTFCSEHEQNSSCCSRVVSHYGLTPFKGREETHIQWLGDVGDRKEAERETGAACGRNQLAIIQW